ncbi:hypothetical protein D9M70_461330 [compost metagenome]
MAAGAGREVSIAKGAAYFNFKSFENSPINLNGSTGTNAYGIVLSGSDGYASGSAWDRQPGYPLRGSTTGGDQGHEFVPLVLNFGPFPAYHFFAPDAKTLYCELEAATGIFLRFGCGSLDLFNPSAPGGGRFFYATGGQNVTNSTSSNSWLGSYVDHSGFAQELVPFRAADYVPSPNGTQGAMVRAAFGSFDNWACSGRTVTSTYQGMVCQGGGCHDKVLRDFSPNPLNGVGILLPNVVSLNVGDEFLSPIGVVPGIRYMDMTNYTPGDEFSLGPDTWKVFPWYQKGGLSVQRGIAYKVVG